MGTYIGGKPLDEWIEEQKKKDGAIYIRRGTVIKGHTKSVYNGGVISYVDSKDLRYENADISTRIKGKTYRFTGNVVERRNGVWFIDGKEAVLPRHESSEDLEKLINDTNRQVSAAFEKAGMVLNEFGGGHVVNGDKVVIGGGSGYGKESRRVTVKSGTVNVVRGSKTYTIKGENIEKRDGQWYADGKPVDWNEIGGEYQESDVVRIEIHGTVQNLVTSSGDVTVNGSVANVSTGSGDVRCDTANNVSTGSGDVHCRNITGMCSTCSGDIFK